MKVSIVGLDKADVLLCLYNNAIYAGKKSARQLKILGRISINMKGKAEEAEKLIKKGNLSFDFVDLGLGSRPIKANLSGTEFDPENYNGYHGDSWAEFVIRCLRQEKSSNLPVSTTTPANTGAKNTTTTKSLRKNHDGTSLAGRAKAWGSKAKIHPESTAIHTGSAPATMKSAPNVLLVEGAIRGSRRKTTPILLKRIPATAKRSPALSLEQTVQEKLDKLLKTDCRFETIIGIPSYISLHKKCSTKEQQILANLLESASIRVKAIGKRTICSAEISPQLVINGETLESLNEKLTKALSDTKESSSAKAEEVAMSGVGVAPDTSNWTQTKDESTNHFGSFFNPRGNSSHVGSERIGDEPPKKEAPRTSGGTPRERVCC